MNGLRSSMILHGQHSNVEFAALCGAVKNSDSGQLPGGNYRVLVGSLASMGTVLRGSNAVDVLAVILASADFP